MTGVLQLMEDGELRDVPRLRKPVEDMWHIVEQRNPEKWRMELEDGSMVSPIDIQRYYLAKLEAIVEDERERRVFKSLEDTLDLLEARKSRELARRVEWLDRYFAIQEKTGAREGPDIEMMACKQYSEIGEDRSVFYRRQRAGLVERTATDDAILRAIREPPPDSRARLRRWLADNFTIETMDWSMVVLNDGGRRSIDLPDPYATELETPYVAAAS